MANRVDVSERVRLIDNEVCRWFGMEEVYDQDLKTRMIVVENNKIIQTHGILSASRVSVLSAIAETDKDGNKLDLIVPKGTQPLRQVVPSIARFPKQYSSIFGSLGRQISRIEKAGLGTFDADSVLSEVAFNPTRPEEVVVLPPYKISDSINLQDLFGQIENELLQSKYLSREGSNVLMQALIEQYDNYEIQKTRQ